MKKQASKKIQSARTNLVLNQPFFGVLALRLALVEDESCDTAWVDGTSLGYNPDFIERLTQDEVVALVAHEVMHCACGHPWRRDARDAERWNIACDVAINGELAKAGFRLPKGGLMPDSSNEGKSAEWIFARLPKDAKQPPPETGRVVDAPSGGDGDEGEPEEGDGEKKKAQSGTKPANEGDWQVAVQQAANIANAQGKLPGSLKRFAQEAVKPKVDWRSVLRRFVQQVAKTDFSWKRPNSRYVAQGLFLPSIRSEELGPILVAVDTSGSIDDVTLREFACEINSIMSEARPERIEVVYCDAEINGEETFERGDAVKLEAKGGGGTDFRPVFEKVAKMDEQPVCVIYLTDLCGDFPPEGCEIPTLWATTQEGVAPFGETMVIA